MSIPIKPVILSEMGFGTDPTMYRWKKGIWAMLLDSLVTFLVLYVIINPCFNFGKVSSSENLRDESMRTFEINQTYHLDGMKIDVWLTPDSWQSIQG